ncbi:MAG: hypothetical protein A3J76_05230 [Candidatus Moranbacteria bacterium RBG_13_45_13]|nr:MAG: hypothetical protein A3J76_05230 [Candidatus Moranbacteria bacterium RBG_13_45_13]
MPNNLSSKTKERLKRFFWHGYWTDPVIFFSLVLAVLANGGIWIALFRTVVPTDLPIILHYNIYFGIDAIGNWKSVFFMPTLAVILLAANIVLSRFFYYKERLVSYLFAGTALALQLLMAVGVISVIIINF